MKIIAGLWIWKGHTQNMMPSGKSSQAFGSALLAEVYALIGAELAVNVCSTPMPLIDREHLERCFCSIHL